MRNKNNTIPGSLQLSKQVIFFLYLRYIIQLLATGHRGFNPEARVVKVSISFKLQTPPKRKEVFKLQALHKRMGAIEKHEKEEAGGKLSPECLHLSANPPPITPHPIPPHQHFIKPRGRKQCFFFSTLFERRRPVGPVALPCALPQ